jgi:hypothetical protein
MADTALLYKRKPMEKKCAPLPLEKSKEYQEQIQLNGLCPGTLLYKVLLKPIKVQRCVLATQEVVLRSTPGIVAKQLRATRLPAASVWRQEF